jgi:mannosyltransferase
MPVIEAMKSGCPVVATNFSSIPEVCDNAAILVDDINAASFVQAIKQLENSDIRNRFINLGLSRATCFNWDTMFEKTMTFYNEIFAMNKL